MEELKAYLYVETPFSWTSRRTIMWLFCCVGYLLAFGGIIYFLYTIDQELMKQVGWLFVGWAALGFCYELPFFLRTYMTIRDGQLAIRYCGVITSKYDKTKIVHVRRNGKKLVIGLQGDRKISLLDSPEARKILERLQIPVR